MLILSRRPNESIYIDVAGIRVKVKVARIVGNTVRLAFDAPPEALIRREEVAKADEAKAATTANPSPSSP